MTLCKYCSALDIRAVLHKSSTQDGDAWDARVPFQPSVLTIREGSQNGCELCAFIWESFMKERVEERNLYYYAGPKGPVTDEQLLERFGSLVWASSRQGHVHIWSPERDNDSISNTVIGLVVAQDPDAPIVDDPEHAGLLSEVIAQDSGSSEALSSAARLLEDCLNNHEHCAWAKHNDKVLPTRVIDVGSDTDAPRLHTTEGATGAWVALSYCWGGDSDFILTAKTSPRLKAGVPLLEFPPTLRDAITTTRALGIQYIWIDALCILQDSIDDWRAEAPKMGQIYTNAEIVIAATASDDVKAGLFRPRKVPESVRFPWKVPAVTVGATSSDQHIRLCSWKFETQELLERSEETRWGGRGWTMQEDFLATRMLSFTKGQLTWDCLSRNTTETGEDRPPSYVFSSSRDYISRYVTRLVSSLKTGQPLSETATDKAYPQYDPDVQKMWYQILHLYSQRDLTKHADRLPALAGLAVYFKQYLGDEYCAGLWRKDLPYGLMWDCGSWGFAGDAKPVLREGPSWSWVSLEGTLGEWATLTTYDIEAEQPPTRVIDVKIDRVSEGDEFGAVRGGTLVIEAPHIIVDAGELEAAPQHASMLQRYMRTKLTDPRYQANAEFSIRHAPFPGQVLAALHISTGYNYVELLLLESVQGEVAGEDEETRFIRVGKLQARKSSEYGGRNSDPSEMFYLSSEEDGAYVECMKGDLSVRKFAII